MNVVFVGREFYDKSATVMSSVYEIKHGTLERTDWGFIQIALEKGQTVNIRPANPDEMGLAYKKLAEIKK